MTEGGSLEETFQVRLAKLNSLKIQRENAQAENLESVKEEDISKQKNNPRLLARMARKKAKFQTIKEKRDAIKANISYERLKSYGYSIEETNSWNRHLKEKHARKNPQFADYGDLAKRKYDKLVAKIQPNIQKRGEPNTTQNPDPFSSFKPSRENIASMVEDVYEQIGKRTMFSKKRRFDPDEDVTYINERNMRFNQKLARAYGAITQELRESVEQGPYLGLLNQNDA